MKKNYLLFAALLICSILTAQDEWTRTEINIVKLEDGSVPTIDGVVDALWADHEQFDILIEDDNTYFTLPSIYETWFKMTWNDSALFLLVYRDDDDFADQWETELADWQSDRDEIFFDVNVDNLVDGIGASDAQADGQGTDYGHYQFTSIWVQDQTEWSGNPGQWYHNAPFTFGYVLDGDEYYSEYEFPFSSLTINTDLLPDADPTFQGGDGVTFGFVITISDVDMSDNPTDETYRKFMRFVDEGGWDSMDSAAWVTMLAEAPPLSVENNNINNISVFPNPANYHIKISNISDPVDIEIRNIIGQFMMNRKNVLSTTEIDISKLSKGIYFITVDNNTTVKFVVN